MKIYGTLLALLSVSDSSAFVQKSPQAPSTELDYGRRYGYDFPGAYGGYGGYGYGGYRGGGYLGGRDYLRNYGYETGKYGIIGSRYGYDVDAEKVEGGALRTWSFMSPAVERVEVTLGTEGRPLKADIELWQGPDNTPQKMSVYIEDGDERPFSAIIESPRGSNTIGVRNQAEMEFPLFASVEPNVRGGMITPLAVSSLDLLTARGRTVQGGSIVTYPFEPSVEQVGVALKTDGRPLQAKIELLQGPNNNKQVIEFYSEDGWERPCMVILDTPGSGNVVRILNTATVEFPMSATVEPFFVDANNYRSRDDSVPTRRQVARAEGYDYGK